MDVTVPGNGFCFWTARACLRLLSGSVPEDSTQEHAGNMFIYRGFLVKETAN